MCFTCDGGSMNEFMQHVAHNIHTHTVTYVPIEGSGFAYSVGMTAQGMPELYADTKSGFSLTSNPLGPEASIARGLEKIAQRLIAEGEGVTTGTRLYEEDDDGTAEIRFRSWSTERLSVARDFYAGKAISALRVVRKSA